jgi:hypothetical protein
MQYFFVLYQLIPVFSQWKLCVDNWRIACFFPYPQSGDSNDYIGQIVEMFEDINHECWFTAQWFFLIQDTVTP